MDKAEYRSKLEEINSLAEEGRFREAAVVADEVDWKHVKSARTLCMIGEIYEADKRYVDSARILRYAYKRSSTSKTVLYRLAELDIRNGDYDEAKRFINEFEQNFPNDTSRHILKYKYLRATKAPIDDQIAALKDYKDHEYTERWAYELARLYKKNGQNEKCIEECDDMILWFSEGKYVTKAMELKMSLTTLTPSQQAAYDNRHLVSENAARESEAAEAAQLTGMESVEKKILTSDEDEDETVSSARGDEAIQRLEQAAETQVQREESLEVQEEPEDKEEPAKEKKSIGAVAGGLQKKLSHSIRAVFSGMKLNDEDEDEDMKIVPDRNERDVEPTLPKEEVSVESVSDFTRGESPAPYEGNAGKAVLPGAAAAAAGAVSAAAGAVSAVSGAADAAPEAGSEEDFKEVVFKEVTGEALPGTEGSSSAEKSGGDFLEVTDEALPGAAAAAGATAATGAAAAAGATGAAAAAAAAAAVSAAAIASAAKDGAVSGEGAQAAKDGAVSGEGVQAAEEERGGGSEKKGSAILPAAGIAAGAAGAAGAAVLSAIASVGAAEKPAGETGDRPDEGDAALKESATAGLDLDKLFAETGDALAGEVASGGYVMADTLESDREQAEEDARFARSRFKEETAGEKEKDPSEDLLARETDESLGLTRELHLRDAIEEELMRRNSGAGKEAEETPRTPIIRPEEAARITVAEAHGTTYDPDAVSDEDLPEEPLKELPEGDGISDEELLAIYGGDEAVRRELLADDSEIPPVPPEESRESLMSLSDAESGDSPSIIDSIMGEPGVFTAVPVEGRALTEPEKKALSYFAAIPGIDYQVTSALADIHNNSGDKTSKSGNVVITGRPGSGKTRLAEGLILMVCMHLGIKAAKTGKIVAESFNEKDPAEIVSRMAGGFLIIEAAGALSDESVDKLNQAMEFRTDAMIVILEDEKSDMKQLLDRHPDFAQKFTSRITVPVFTNDELVTFARTYAREEGYKFDEMATVALYTMIGDNQRDAEPMTVGKVRQLVDKAIEKNSRKLFGKITDKEDGRIVLTEKDFNF